MKDKGRQRNYCILKRHEERMQYVTLDWILNQKQNCSKRYCWDN